MQRIAQKATVNGLAAAAERGGRFASLVFKQAARASFQLHHVIAHINPEILDAPTHFGVALPGGVTKAAQSYAGAGLGRAPADAGALVRRSPIAACQKFAV